MQVIKLTAHFNTANRRLAVFPHDGFILVFLLSIAGIRQSVDQVVGELVEAPLKATCCWCVHTDCCPPHVSLSDEVFLKLD